MIKMITVVAQKRMVYFFDAVIMKSLELTSKVGQTKMEQALWIRHFRGSITSMVRMQERISNMISQG